MVVAVQCCFGAIGLLNPLVAGAGHGRTTGYVSGLGAVLAIQFIHCAPSARRIRDRYGGWTLLAQGLLVLGTIPAFGTEWGGTAGFLAGSALHLVDRRVAWAVTAAVVGEEALMAGLSDPGPGAVAYLALVTATAGLVTYGLMSLADAVSDVHREGTVLTRLVLAEERRRFARDLHDLLGYSLTAITLKSEVTHGMVGRDNARAREELREILSISRQALTDVRDVAHASHGLPLTDELASIRDLLDAAGIRTEARVSVDQLPERVDGILSMVLREGVTNMLGHSSARRCRIAIRADGGRVRLTLSNDGASPGSRSADGAGPEWSVDHRPGHGLDNLATRLANLGGTLRVSVDRDWFHLIADCPVDS